MADENYSLVKGSIYRIMSAGSGETAVTTEGEFLGYVPFGDESAVVIRMTSRDSIRIIPCNTVFYVDVVRQEKEKKKTEVKEEIKFYG